jgi:hypothetical protein
VIEPVIERHTGDSDAVIAHVGEIGEPSRPGKGSCRKTTSRSAPLSARQVRMRRSKTSFLDFSDLADDKAQPRHIAL